MSLEPDDRLADVDDADGEVFELRRKDIDTVTGVVHVRRGVV